MKFESEPSIKYFEFSDNNLCILKTDFDVGADNILQILKSINVDFQYKYVKFLTDKEVNPLANTEISVGKYLTDSLLLKYNIALKENNILPGLYYQHQFGIEWRILPTLNFEWLYKPVFTEDLPQNVYEQKYKLEWKKKISF